jgi:RHS repeat-associated protein
VARFRSSDTSPKEQFVAHQAGLDGRGGSSYIDLVACRNKDADTSWTSASDTVLEERVYYCQNWRADVSALVKSDGKMLEWVKYSAYGVPFGLPNGDSNSDGDCDAGDSTQISAWSGVSYDVRGDLDLDGDVDSTDASMVVIGVVGGRGALSTVQSDRGYGGMVGDTQSCYQARQRTVSTALGRWLSRDSLGYVDGENLLAFVGDAPHCRVDPTGNVGSPSSTPFGTVNPGLTDTVYRPSRGGSWPMPASPNPIPGPPPPGVEECLDAPPVGPDSPLCYIYGPCEYMTFGPLHVNLRCFCQCAGDSKWANDVRACLACAKFKGVDPDVAHIGCYVHNVKKHGPPDPLAWATCLESCAAYQFFECP